VVLSVVNIKITIFLDVIPCSLVDTSIVEASVASILRVEGLSLFFPEDEGSRFL
jgi:hypothetical protein